MADYRDVLLGLLFKKTSQNDAYVGFVAGIIAMTLVLSMTKIDFTWHTFIDRRSPSSPQREPMVPRAGVSTQINTDVTEIRRERIS